MTPVATRPSTFLPHLQWCQLTMTHSVFSPWHANIQNLNVQPFRMSSVQHLLNARSQTPFYPETPVQKPLWFSSQTVALKHQRARFDKRLQNATPTHPWNNSLSTYLIARLRHCRSKNLKATVKRTLTFVPSDLSRHDVIPYLLQIDPSTSAHTWRGSITFIQTKTPR